MGVFEQFPYANMHEMNLDWLLKKMKELDKAMETFKATESLKFADPIIWDITTQYEKSTIVLDPTGNAYLSLQAVPAGVQLNNEEYWLEIFNFTDYTRTANQNLTVNTETNTTRATAAYQVDDWLIWNDVLYRVTSAIAIDDALIVAPAAGSNIIHFTVEDFIKAFITYATGLINQYKDDIDESELLYRQQLAQDIADTTASLQAQLDQAISGATVDSEVINARIGADGKTYDTLGNAIRSQFEGVTGMIDAYNVNNLIDYNSVTGSTVNAVKCTPTYHSITMESVGTTSTNSWFILYNSVPITNTDFVAGETYKLFIAGIENTNFQMVSYDIDNVSNIFVSRSTNGWTEITIPSDCVKLLIRLRITAGTTYNEDVTIIISKTLPNIAITNLLFNSIEPAIESNTNNIAQLNVDLMTKQAKTIQMYGQVSTVARSYTDVDVDEDGYAYYINMVGIWNTSTSSWTKYNGQFNGLCKFDVTDPQNPVLVAHNRLFDYNDSEQDCYNPTRVAVKNGYVYVSCRDAASGTGRYNTSSDDTNGYLFILDAATLTIQKTIKYHGTEDNDWWGKAVGVSVFADERNSYLAVALQKAGYVIYDLTNDPVNPTQIYRYTPNDPTFEVQSGTFFIIPGQNNGVYFALSGFTSGIVFLRIWRPDNTVVIMSTFAMPAEALEGHSFDCRVKYPYCYATLAPKRSDIHDTSVPRAGIIVIDIRLISNPSLEQISWIPKDENTLIDISDTMPTFIEYDMLNEFIYVNNGELGFAVFKVDESGIPYYVGCIKRDGDNVKAIKSDGYRLYTTGIRNYTMFAEKPYLSPSAFRIYNAMT